MAYQYIDIEFTLPNVPSQRIDIKGDKNARLNKIVIYEVGMRHQLDFNDFIEIEIFHSEIKDFTNLIIQQPVIINGQTVVKRSLENILKSRFSKAPLSTGSMKTVTGILMHFLIGKIQRFTIKQNHFSKEQTRLMSTVIQLQSIMLA
jgi:hypothetical protein